MVPGNENSLKGLGNNFNGPINDRVNGIDIHSMEKVINLYNIIHVEHYGATGSN